MFWKLYTGPFGAAHRTADKLLGAGASPADLWSSCSAYVENPSLESFRAFRRKLFTTPVVATAATFPAFICPERFPMVDKQVTKWALENGSGGDVLRESHWPFVESWIAWCQFTAGKLSQCSGCTWRARDVEMAVFTAQRARKLDPLASLA